MKKLVNVQEVEDAGWTNKTFQDEQKLHAKTLYVSTSAIEAFGVSK